MHKIPDGFVHISFCGMRCYMLEVIYKWGTDTSTSATGSVNLLLVI